MAYMKYQDTLVGSEGIATLDIKGNIENAFFIKKLDAKLEKDKAEGKTLGKRATQHKAKGWKGKGNMTIYYVTTLFRQLAYEYAKSGKDIYFDITVENNDPASQVTSTELGGAPQVICLLNCNINSTTLALINVDSEALEEEVDFTFDDFEIINAFGSPNLF